jgi:hypothetical protein
MIDQDRIAELPTNEKIRLGWRKEYQFWSRTGHRAMVRWRNLKKAGEVYARKMNIDDVVDRLRKDGFSSTEIGEWTRFHYR